MGVSHGISVALLPCFFIMSSLLWVVVTSLTVSAPPSCGGPRVITHATAFFGPRPSQPATDLVPIFAAFPGVSGDEGGGGSRVRVVRGKESLDNGCQLRGKNNAHMKVAKSRWKEVKGKVGFIVRGGCDFVDKVIGLEHLGAVGVVVVNLPIEGRNLANMKVNETHEQVQSKIPAVMVRWRDWAMLSRCRSHGVRVAFTRDGEATLDADYGRGALNWILMRGMALWILCQCGVNVVRYTRRSGELRARAEAIAALPVLKYTKTGRDGENEGKPGSEDNDDRVSSTPAGLHKELDRNGAPESARGTLLLSSSGPSFPSREWWALRASGEISPQDKMRRTDVNHKNSNTERRQALGDSKMASSRGKKKLVGRSKDAGSHVITGKCTSWALSSPSISFLEDNEEPLCPVCFEYFIEGQVIRKLKCGHQYCVGCIDKWLRESSNSCPVCKQVVANLPPLTPGHRSVLARV